MSAFSTTIADVDPWTGDQLSDLMLGLLAERAAKDVIVHWIPPWNGVRRARLSDGEFTCEKIQICEILALVASESCDDIRQSAQANLSSLPSTFGVRRL